MSTPSSTDAESFYDFLGHTLNSGGRELPPEALLRKWRDEREFEETCEDIRQGIANMEARKGHPADQAFAELRRKHALPPRNVTA